jgi:UDP-N-acetylglucosamine 4,6-dehydratase/5-epimerase
MSNVFSSLENGHKLRYFLGDVRDRDRLMMAFEGVDLVIHAAALKQVPAAEYNPFEFIKTNILGAQNIIECAIERDVEKVIALSTDKAANPINLYGATKFCSDKLFVAANQYSAYRKTRFSVVRYGNVIGSRGSVIPFFLKQRKSGILTLTHQDMTRFWITLQQATNFVLNCMCRMAGREIFIPKIPSMHISNLAKFMGKECEIKTIGIRPGEKLHEVMIPNELGRSSLDMKSYFIIKPSDNDFAQPDYWSEGKTCEEDFEYNSGTNPEWIDDEALILEAISSIKSEEALDFVEEMRLT